MNKYLFLSMALAAFFLSGCQPASTACQWPPGTSRYLTSALGENLPVAAPGPSPTPASVTIGGNAVRVDKIVEGPLCNDTWSGTIYVGCNVQVYPYDKQPLFLKNCNLKIEPGTVVYVAYHNNATYYNGCSCHTGLATKP